MRRERGGFNVVSLSTSNLSHLRPYSPQSSLVRTNRLSTSRLDAIPPLCVSRSRIPPLPPLFPPLSSVQPQLSRSPSLHSTTMSSPLLRTALGTTPRRLSRFSSSSSSSPPPSSASSYLAEQARLEEEGFESEAEKRRKAKLLPELREPAWDGEETRERMLQRILQDQYKPLRVKVKSFVFLFLRITACSLTKKRYLDWCVGPSKDYPETSSTPFATLRIHFLFLLSSTYLHVRYSETTMGIRHIFQTTRTLPTRPWVPSILFTPHQPSNSRLSWSVNQ